MIHKLFGSAALDGAASIDIREDGRITGILLVLTGTGLQDGSFLRGEVSFSSTNGFTSNDTTAALIGNELSYELLTSGGSNFGATIFVPLDEPAQSGERLYLHVGAMAVSGIRATAFVYTDAKGSRPSVRRR
jgi:hypothetical protein